MKLETGKKYDVAALTAAFEGWTGEADGYNVADYFDADGRYLGPDEHGVEPMFANQTKWTTDTASAALAECSIAEEVPLMQQISANTGWPIIEGVLVPEPEIWHADDGNCEVVGEHDSGHDAAQSYVDGGEWGDIESGVTIDVTVWREGIDSEGDVVRVDVQEHGITILPEEPECAQAKDGAHDWQYPHGLVGGCDSNPGVWATGGTSFEFLSVCANCGIFRRETSTGAQRNPGDAKKTVEYLPPTTESLAWVSEQ